MLTDLSVVITAQHTNVPTPQGTPQTSAGLVPALRPYSCGGRPRGTSRARTKEGAGPAPGRPPAPGPRGGPQDPGSRVGHRRPECPEGTEGPERPEGPEPGGRRAAWERGMRGQDRRPTDPWTSAGTRWWAEGRDREEARGAPLPGRTPATSGRSGAAALGRGRRFAGPSPARPLRSPKVWPPERLPSLVPPPQSPLGARGSCPCGKLTLKVWRSGVAGSKGNSATAGRARRTQGGWLGVSRRGSSRAGRGKGGV